MIIIYILCILRSASADWKDARKPAPPHRTPEQKAYSDYVWKRSLEVAQRIGNDICYYDNEEYK